MDRVPIAGDHRAEALLVIPRDCQGDDLEALRRRCKSGELECAVDGCEDRRLTAVKYSEVRGHPVAAHFRHVSGGGHEGESHDHLMAKHAVHSLALGQGLRAELELWSSDAERRPDVAVWLDDDRRVAIEIQYSQITDELWGERTAELEAAGFIVQWAWGVRGEVGQRELERLGRLYDEPAAVVLVDASAPDVLLARPLPAIADVEALAHDLWRHALQARGGLTELVTRADDAPIVGGAFTRADPLVAWPAPVLPPATMSSAVEVVWRPATDFAIGATGLHDPIAERAAASTIRRGTAELELAIARQAAELDSLAEREYQWLRLRRQSDAYRNDPNRPRLESNRVRRLRARLAELEAKGYKPGDGGEADKLAARLAEALEAD